MTTPDLSYIHESLRHLAIPISDLTIDPNNVRRHSEANTKAICRSYKRFGQRKPIVVRKKGMVIEAGNGTLASVKQLGWTHLACVICDDDDKEAVAFAIADNRTAELAEWDHDALGSQLFDLMDNDFDLDDVGFSSDDLDEVVSHMSKTAEDIKAEEAKSKKGGGRGRKIKHEEKATAPAGDDSANPPTVPRPAPPNQDFVELKKPDDLPPVQPGINRFLCLFDDQQFDDFKSFVHEIKVFHDTTDNSTAVFEAVKEAALRYRRG